MFFSQHVVDGLACFSYLVGDEETGEAIVVDPDLDVDGYIKEAADADLTIRHIIDTHLHADHVSGARRLADRTGATIHLPAKARAKFPHERVQEGDTLRLGDVLIRVRETPGHTPEHVSLEVLDLSRGTELPYAVLTGDTLLVGSAGRPDLVGTTDADTLARQLYASFQNVIAHWPDGVLVAPGHGAGSACGANVGRVRLTTLGYERETNPYFHVTDEAMFVEMATRDLPPKPGNAPVIKKVNTAGPPTDILASHEVPRLDAEAFASATDRDEAIALDLRPPDAFAANHVPRSVNVPCDAQFAGRAARLLETAERVALILPDGEDAEGTDECLRSLARVGGIHVVGVLKDGMSTWREAGRPFSTMKTMDVQELYAMRNDRQLNVLDVRGTDEWERGHLEGAVSMPWETLATRAAELDADAPWVTMCGSGTRSSIAASLLRRMGFTHVGNLMGGMTAWRGAGYPTVQESAVSEA